MTTAALDPGRAGLKRVTAAGAPAPGRVAGALREPPPAGAAGSSAPGAGPGAAPGGDPGAEALAAALAALPAGVRRAAVAPDEDAAARLERAHPDVVGVPAALAVALAHEPAAGPAEVEAVLDLGRGAGRLAFVRWHRVGRAVFPREVGPTGAGQAGAAPDDAALAPAAWEALGGAALEALVAAACRVEPPCGPDEARALARGLLPLLGASRGPWAWSADGRTARLDPGPAADALRAWADGAARALAEVAARVAAGRAGRVLVAGGLCGLAPARALVERALGGGAAPVVFDPQPGWAAARGAARALTRPATPRLEGPLALVLRAPAGVERVALAPAGARLPGRFGPARVRRAGPGAGADVLVQATIGDAVHEARVPAPPGDAPLEVEVAWDFAGGLEVLCGGARAPLVPAAPAAADAVRAALAFPWRARSEAVPLDLAFVFRATRGGAPPAAAAVTGAVRDLAEAARARGAGVRLRAIATGDHPQGHLRPDWVTLAQPTWTDDPAALAAWVAARLAAPIDGIDAPEAFECALRDAADLDWRPDATRGLVVLSDVPPHEPEEPPYCAVSWRAEAERLRRARVALVPVHVAISGLPPSVRRPALAFLEALGHVHALRAGPLDPALVAAVEGLAGARRWDPAAQRALDAVGAALA